MGKYLRALKNWRSHLNLIYWLGGHAKPYWPRLAALLAFNTLDPFITLGMMMLTRSITDNAIAKNNIVSDFSLYVIMIVISIAVATGSGILGMLTGEWFSFGIRRKIYGRVLRALFPSLRLHSGDTLTRLTSDVTTVAVGLTDIIPSVFSTVVGFLVAFGALIYFDWRLTILAMILGPVTALVGIVAGKMVKDIQVKVQESESAYRSTLQETIANLVVIKAFEAEDIAEERFSGLRDDRIFWIRKRLKISTISQVSMTLLFQLGGAAVFAYGATRISAGTLTMGTLMMMTGLVSQIQDPISQLAQMVPRIVSIVASAGRIRVLEDLPPEDFTCPELESPGGLSVEINGLSFSYGEEKGYVLENTDMRISAGEFVALMGSSGVGKTTLIRLILAFYTPSAGSIELIDSAGRRGTVNAGARAYMAYVPQGNTLISGTIADNLRTGKRDATEEEMWEVLRVVSADQFVRDTPNGLETAVGERGSGLSEGQAQRLAIARALIRRAPLLILDEATSALDEDLELSVLEHLRAREPRPTCVLITHRRSVLRFCDRCVLLQNRRIVEQALEARLPSNGGESNLFIS